MRGAAKRRENRLSEVWYTAMLPHLKETPSLEDFVGRKPDPKVALLRCIAAWDQMDRALSRRH